MSIRNPASLTEEQREAARYIPTGARRLVVKDCDAVVFWKDYERNGKAAVHLVAYRGKAVRHCGNYTFHSADRASKWIAELRKSAMDHDAATAAYKAKRTVANTLKPGDVLRSSWGYDQTNVDYYQVTRVSDRCAWVREIGAMSYSTGDMTGQCFPSVGDFIGEEKRYLVQHGNAIRIASYAMATKMDYSEPAPDARVYKSSSWSSYA